MKDTFAEKAFTEYVEWQSEDKKTLNRINKLIQSIQREGFMCGTGKPEVLKNNGHTAAVLMTRTG